MPDNREQRQEIMEYFIPDLDDFLTKDQWEQIPDAAKRAATEKRVETQWYLAHRLGQVLAVNPDLQFDESLEPLPTRFTNPLVARFWLPSISWILEFGLPLPEVKLGQLPAADPLEKVRSRALRLFLTQLRAEAEARNRELAVKLANRTALRRNPEVLAALDVMLAFEKREEVTKIAKRVLSTGREQFLQDLRKALESEKTPQTNVAEKAELPADLVEDFTYFRDHVIPEMSSLFRGDQRACMSCHGVPGRVPSMQLNKPDDVGYLSISGLLENYRILQQRVHVTDVENSKLLRKPLNLQSTEDEGHQGGRRYKPSDDGYQILRRWALNQAKMRSSELPVGAAP